MNLNNKIASGQQADVYRDGDVAIKFYREDISKTAVFYESWIHSKIEDTGLTVPKIQEVLKVDGKWAITMDYIEGKTLYDLMMEDPEHLEDYLNTMVDLQIDVHKKKTTQLSRQKDRFINKIQSLEELDESKEYELLARLDGMPKHRKLCHGDFHPMNIMVKDGQYYITDWVNATRGNGSADVANTFLLISLKDKDLAKRYLELYCEKTNTRKSYVQKWIPIVAAVRLTEHNEGERDMLLEWLDVID